MKIALVNNNYFLGGAETVMHQLHEGYTKLGHESTLHIAWGTGIPRSVKLMYPRVLARLEVTRLNKLVNYLFPKEPWTDRVFRSLANSDADLIHIHSFHGIYARTESLAEVARAKPVVWTFHRFWGVTGGCDHPGACRRYLDSCGDCPRVNEWPICGKDNTRQQLQRKKETIALAPLTVISPSHHLAKTVRESPVGRHWRVEVIPNGVEPSQFRYARKRDIEFRKSLGLPENGLLVLTVIRDFKDALKGFDTIKGALESLPKGSPATFCFAGMNSAWAIGICPDYLNYIDLGYITDRARLGRLFEAVDIFLYASPGENFPCVILEAMSSQCCIVSTPTDGVLEQVRHLRSGVLAEDFNPESLARALNLAVTNAELRSSCGLAARQEVENRFSEKKMVQDHLVLYEDIMSKACK